MLKAGSKLQNSVLVSFFLPHVALLALVDSGSSQQKNLRKICFPWPKFFFVKSAMAKFFFAGAKLLAIAKLAKPGKRVCFGQPFGAKSDGLGEIWPKSCETWPQSENFGETLRFKAKFGNSEWNWDAPRMQERWRNQPAHTNHKIPLSLLFLSLSHLPLSLFFLTLPHPFVLHFFPSLVLSLSLDDCLSRVLSLFVFCLFLFCLYEKAVFITPLSLGYVYRTYNYLFRSL